MKGKCDILFKAIERNGSIIRIVCNAILIDKNSKQSDVRANYSNMEVEIGKPLTLADFQLICAERGLWDKMSSKNGIKLKDVDCEYGIGKSSYTDQEYYYVKATLIEDFDRMFFLSKSQIRNLKNINLGYEFTRD